VSSANTARRDKPAAVLCTGIAVQDIVLLVARFPAPAGKEMASEIATVCGGCAANAAIVIARLGGRAHCAGPLGNGGFGDHIMAALAREVVGTDDVVLVAGATTPVSLIMITLPASAGSPPIATGASRWHAWPTRMRWSPMSC
jgi:sugar/nucleoside kinase (ribokinase family)